MSNVPSDSREAIKRQILDAYGFESAAELDAAIEQELPGYLAAETERKAREAEYAGELPGRMEIARQSATALLQSCGMLPDGFELAWSDA